MNDTGVNFWRAHLSNKDTPLVHFVSASFLNMNDVEDAAQKCGFTFFSIHAREVTSELSLMDEFAQSMNFLPDFGRNWNALLDLLQDLPRMESDGYVLLITGADKLPRLPDKLFTTFVAVLEATLWEWRDGSGMYGERTASVAFHIVFSGGTALRDALLDELREPFCEHAKECLMNIFPAPVRLRKTELYQDAEKLVAGGADPETALAFLREHGMDEGDSTYSIAGLTKSSVTDAKSLLYNSRTWAEIREREALRRKMASDLLRELGYEDDWLRNQESDND